MLSLDPNNLIAGAARRVASNIAPGLCRLDDAWHPEPDLAASWEFNEDGSELTSRLRDGLTFHSGRRVTAEAVRQNFERILDPRAGCYQRADYAVIDRIDVLDELTVRFVLSEPFAPFPSLLANSTGIADLDGDPETQATSPVGAGPFTLQSWERGSHLRLVRFAGPNPPQPSGVDEVRWIFEPDPAERTRMLADDEIDLCWMPLAGDLGRLREAGFVVDVQTGHGPTHITFDCSEPPFNDIRARLAIAHAVDRESMIQRLFHGLGTATFSSYAPGSPWFVELSAHPFDPDRARHLLKAAGLDDLRITLPVDSDFGRRMGVLVAEDLARVGIRAEVVPYPSPVWWPGFYTSGSWQVILQSWTPMPDPDQLLRRRYHTRGRLNGGQYSEPAVDELLDRGRRTLDPGARRAVYGAVQEIVMRDAVSVYLFHAPAIAAWNPRVQGFHQTPISEFRLAGVSVDSASPTGGATSPA